VTLYAFNSNLLLLLLTQIKCTTQHKSTMLMIRWHFFVLRMKILIQITSWDSPLIIVVQLESSSHLRSHLVFKASLWILKLMGTIENSALLNIYIPKPEIWPWEESYETSQNSKDALLRSFCIYSKKKKNITKKKKKKIKTSQRTSTSVA